MDDLAPPDPDEVTLAEWINWALRTIVQTRRMLRRTERQLQACRRKNEELKQTRD